MEKNCKWYFDKSGNSITGPNDSIHETFRANPYYSIVRESIQNCIDAVDNEKEPVKVVFEFGSIEKKNYPRLFQIKEHINACREYHKGDKQAERHYAPMVEYIDQNEKIEYLKVSDYNSIGMEYDSSNVNCRFTSFVRSEGKSAKESGAGGSFGFGKGAYFVLSRIKTLLVLTKTNSGNLFFEGKTRLSTHKINEETLTRDGYYKQDNDTPILREADIPVGFERKASGTDIYILGLIETSGNRISEMVISVLNNFWLAVYHDKLTVEIIGSEKGKVLINKETLEKLMEDYFQGEQETGGPSNIGGWNPKPYYKAVRNSGYSDNYLLFQENLQKLGEVKLYVYLGKGLPNRIAYFRKPRMVVQKKTRNKLNGYVGVLLCENEKGNELLRQMENAAHNEWKWENYRDADDNERKTVKAAQDELKKFVDESLESLSNVDKSKKIHFLGLEEFLSIPEDLLENEDVSDSPGNNGNSYVGSESKEFSQDETGMQTTEIRNMVLISPTVKKYSNAKTEAGISDDGEEDFAFSGVNDGSGGDIPGEGEGNAIKQGGMVDGSKDSKVLIPLNLKVAAQKEQETMFHYLIINSERNITNTELELLLSSDNDRDAGIELVSTNNGRVVGNKLKEVKLSTGKNEIKVQFADNIKHSVKIKAHEIR